MKYSDQLDEFHKERKSELFMKSKSFRTLWSYFRDILATDSVTEFMIRERERHDIPKAGFPLDEERQTHIHPPKQWVHFRDRRRLEEIRTDLRKLCQDYFLLSRGWATVFEYYLFWNAVKIPLEPNAYNLCFVSNVRTRRDSVGAPLWPEEELAYPIVIHVSPYASRNSVEDYIKKFWTTEVVRLQKQYQDPHSEIGRHKSKRESVRRRNGFLFLNRHMPHDRLLDLVNSLFPTAKLKHKNRIGKLIATEGKRRRK